MKKTLLAIAAAGLLPAAANAQSSVTLYGLIDAGVKYTHNVGGDSRWQAGQGLLNGSRWGLKGQEDLGGGVKALFTLENGFDIGNGDAKQGGRMFGRQAYVGLSSTTAGTFTIGRQYDTLVDHLAPLSFAGDMGVGAHPFDNDNLDNSMRVNNSVKYTSANYGGLKFGAMYGFANKAGEFSNGRVVSAGASYDNGPLRLGAGYLNAKGADIGNNSVGAFNTEGAPSGGHFFGRNVQVYGLGGKVSMGPATVGLVVTHSRQQVGAITTQDAITSGIDNTRFTNFEVNGKYMLRPDLSLAAAYTYTIASQSRRLFDASTGVASTEHVKPGYHTFAMQANYYLSKRTDVYLAGSYQRASYDVAWIPAADKPSSTRNQILVGAGMRHRF